MRKLHAIHIATFAALFGLAACGRPDLGPGAASFGNAVKQNIAVQATNPDPQPVTTPPPMEGNRAAIAIGRYQADEVKPPRELRTSDVGD